MRKYANWERKLHSGHVFKDHPASDKRYLNVLTYIQSSECLVVFPDIIHIARDVNRNKMAPF